MLLPKTVLTLNCALTTDSGDQIDIWEGCVLLSIGRIVDRPSSFEASPCDCCLAV